MRPESGLKVLRDITESLATSTGGNSSLPNVPAADGSTSTAAAPRKLALPLGHVSKVTDRYIEVRWTGDGNKAEKIQAKDDGTFGLKVLASGLNLINSSLTSYHNDNLH